MLELMGLALSNHPVTESVVAVVASPVEQPAGVTKILKRILDGIRGCLMVLRIPCRARKSIEDAEQVLLAREIRQDPFLAVPLPYGRLESIHIDSIHEQRRLLRAVRVAPVFQYVVSEDFDRLEILIHLLLASHGRPGQTACSYQQHTRPQVRNRNPHRFAPCSQVLPDPEPGPLYRS